MSKRHCKTLNGKVRYVYHRCKTFPASPLLPLGMHLSEEIRKEILDLNTEIQDLSIKFSKNLGEENTVKLFSQEQLDGMPEDFLAGCLTSVSI